MKAIARFLFLCAALGIHAQEASTLKLVKTIPLSGVTGRFDHFSVDLKNRRLYFAALGNNTLEVVDIAAGTRLKSVTGLRKPTGVLYLPESNQIAVANGDDGTFRLYDASSYGLTTTLHSLDDADNVRIDPGSKTIVVGYGEGALGIVDPKTTKLTGSVKLAAHPESFQLERQGDRIYVNVPDAKQVAVVDRVQKTVVATWPMTRFRGNFPMAFDEANQRLFIGCREPARLVVLDTSSGKAVTDLAISDDTDDLFYDAKRHRLYVSCGEGFIDVIQQQSADRYERVERVATRHGARTSFFSPELNELYLAVPLHNRQGAELRVFKTD